MVRLKTGCRQRWISSGNLRPSSKTLAASPELMGLESRRTGIRAPFHMLRQVSMQTPSGRSIAPDLVMFAASGHVVVVEVKRWVNPELKDRAVIAQIIDYASSFAHSLSNSASSSLVPPMRLHGRSVLKPSFQTNRTLPSWLTCYLIELDAVS